jgi:phenylalanyl-tRNA synthetase beta chain
MKIVYSWLADHVDGELPLPEALAERLTFGGLEVEGIMRTPTHPGVVVGVVRRCEAHPDADRLTVCTVDDGSGATRQVVCGAPNVREGMRAPYAPPGIRLPGDLEIAEREVRGVASAGMLLSARELDLWDDHVGLLDLGPDAAAGAPLAEVLGLGDAVLEVSATPNRPDALSHVGVARDAAALLELGFSIPRADVVEGADAAGDAATIFIDDPVGCPRYVARVIEDVTIGPSPVWLAARLASAGIRPINNVVDVTNYVLLELGHPLHAFDLDRLGGATIRVRRAKGGEVMRTLDDVERRLEPDDLVIADAAVPVALAGVMGGGDSEVTGKTRRILLESAYFEPVGVRRTARRHGLHTEASHRFERGADPNVVRLAADRAAALIAELCGGRVRKGAIDVHPAPAEAGRVTLRFARTDAVLGMPVPPRTQVAILERLGFRCLSEDAGEGTFEVPTFRTEMTREVDLIEEVARIHGYDAIPATLPARRPEPEPEAEAPAAHVGAVVGRLREAAAAAGCREVVNYSFLSEDEVRAVLAADESDVDRREGRLLRISNPLSAEQSVMRTTVLVSLLSNLRHNRRFQRGDLALYEIGRVYLADPGGLVHEPTRFAAIFSGRRAPVAWTTGDEKVDFYDAKGLVEAALARAGLHSRDVRFVPSAAALPWLHPGSACRVETVDGKDLGWLGEVHPLVAERLDVPRGVMAVELEVDAIAGVARLVPEYAGVPRFPAVLRDLAVVVDAGLPADRVRAALEAPLPEAESAGIRVVEATLFDVFTGPQVGEGKRSLAWAIRYQAEDRTLTETEAAGVQEALVTRLERDLGARLRG